MSWPRHNIGGSDQTFLLTIESTTDGTIRLTGRFDASHFVLSSHVQEVMYSDKRINQIRLYSFKLNTWIGIFAEMRTIITFKLSYKLLRYFPKRKSTQWWLDHIYGIISMYITQWHILSVPLNCNTIYIIPLGLIID